jgi:hypothetical protein
VFRSRLVWVIFGLACSGCAGHAGVSAADVESIARGSRATVLVLGTGNKWSARTEPDLYMVVEPRRATPADKVQTDLSECQAAARTVWSSSATERDRTLLASEGPAYNPGAQISKTAMALLAKSYEDCLQPRGYLAGRPDAKD